jgi:hypothetical protein
MTRRRFPVDGRPATSGPPSADSRDIQVEAAASKISIK